jgi:hypothetical protein
MNPNHPSPEDRKPFADDGGDPQRLAEIEQRLKTARPRPAELDIDAIVRSARAADQPVVLPESASSSSYDGPPRPSKQEDSGESTGSEAHRTAESRVSRDLKTRSEPAVERGTRSYRWIIAIAGSWACGAIAGALVTFMLLSRGAPAEESSDGMTAVNERTPEVVESSEKESTDDDAEQPAREESLRKNAPLWSPSDSLVAVMLLDPYGRGVAPYGDGGPTLRAGDFARRQDGLGSWRLWHRTSAMPQDWSHTPDPGADARQDTTPASTRAPSITQEQLLHELLGTRPDSVL